MKFNKQQLSSKLPRVMLTPLQQLDRYQAAVDQFARTGLDKDHAAIARAVTPAVASLMDQREKAARLRAAELRRQAAINRRAKHKENLKVTATITAVILFLSLAVAIIVHQTQLQAQLPQQEENQEPLLPSSCPPASMNGTMTIYAASNGQPVSVEKVTKGEPLCIGSGYEYTIKS
jgi:hypothetical protein